MTNTERIQANNAELREAIEMAEKLPNAGQGGESLPTQEKEIDITENGTVEVKPDEGYTLSKVTTNVAVPIPEGYEDVTTETIEYTAKLATLENALTALEAELEGKAAGGGGTELEDALLANEINGEYVNARITYLGGYHFLLSKNLTAVSFPNVKSTGTNPFQQCTKLTNVSMPSLVRAANYMVYGCSALSKLDLPSMTAIGTAAMQACTGLTALILRSATLCKLENTNALTRTPMVDGTGYIYVPKALVEDYKAATNWSTLASQFRAIEDYPEICGGGA